MWQRTYPGLGLHAQLDQHHQDTLGAEQGTKLPDTDVASDKCA